MAVISQFTDFALRFGTVTPIGNEIPGAAGDLYIWQNGVSSQLFISTGNTNTDWQGIAAGSFTALSALVWNLVDNNAAALTIGTAGFASMMVFDTQNAAEAITFGETLLTNLHIGVRDFAENILTPTFLVSTNHTTGNASEAFALPARTGGWRLVDAYIRSRGGAAGTAVLQDAAGGNAMTNLIAVGAANVRTQAGSLIQPQEDVPSAASPAWTGAGGPPAFDGYSLWVGL